VLFEGNMAQGPQAAIELLVKMPGARHAIETLDSQPIQDKVTNVLVTGKLVVSCWRCHAAVVRLFSPSVVGDSSEHRVMCAVSCVFVQLEGQTNPLNFAQLFQIVIDESGAHVACDMFRLNYG
jgi:hypothetical protein